MLRPRRLTRYVWSELAAATLVAVAVWTVILLLNDLFFIARQAIQKDLGLPVVLQILGLKIPNLLVLSIPIGTLLGSLIAVGRLSADGEIVAFQAAGWGPSQLLRPMALHGLGAFAVALLIYAFLQPWASYQLRAMQGEILTARNVTTEIRPRVFFDALPGYVLFVDEIPAGTQGILERAVLYQSPDPNGSSEQLIIAKHATVAAMASKDARLRLTFRDGVAQSFHSNDPESYRSFQFETFVPAPIVLPPWMQPAQAHPDKTVSDMNPAEIWREYSAAKRDPPGLLRGYRLRSADSEAHRRIALPFASMVFALLALPLGVTRVRSGKGAGFALSLGIILAYWMVFTVGLQQGRDGRVPVALGIWAANALVLAWMIVSYLRMRKPARAPLWLQAVGVVRAGIRRLSEWRRSGRDKKRAQSAVPELDLGRPGGLRLASVLDRYIGMLYLRMLGLTLGATYLIFSLVELKGLIDSVVERKQPAILVLRYFKYFVPGALIFTLPFGAMIAAVLAVTVLSRHGELTALKASGMSIRRICLPVLVMTLAFCGVLHLVQDRIAPETNRRAQAIKDAIQGRNPRTYGWSPGGRWTFGNNGLLYHYRLFDPQAMKFQGLTVFRVDLAAARILEQWFCQTAHWDGRSWDTEKGWYRSFPEAGAAGEYRRFDRELVSEFDPPESFTQRERTLIAGSDLPQQASIAELDDQIDSLARSGYDTTQLRVEYWQKTAAIATPFVTVLLGLPFAFKVGRRGSMYGVGVGLVLAIVFWATAAIFNALGLETLLPPLLAAWAPNVFFTAVGASFLLYAPT